MVVTGALKVAAVAVAVAVAAWVTFAVGLMSLDGDERLRGAVDGRWLAGRHPWMVAAMTMGITGGITATFALLVAAIAWAVGA